jgi:acetyltransferase-like isoleucine patch superfamily enzyme
MSLLKLLLNKRNFDKSADRIGPDLPFTHWRIYFKPLMRKLCENKFKHFGDNAEFRPGAYAIACSKISIGKRVVIRPGSMLFADPAENGAGITIEDDVLIGSGVHFYVGNHNYTDPEIPIIDQGHFSSSPVLLKKGCWIGANSILLPGVVIGKNTVIGAGSVVTKSIPDCVIAAGNPCKIIRSIV